LQETLTARQQSLPGRNRPGCRGEALLQLEHPNPKHQGIVVQRIKLDRMVQISHGIVVSPVRCPNGAPTY
jgi:hypothetical protein